MVKNFFVVLFLGLLYSCSKDASQPTLDWDVIIDFEDGVKQGLVAPSSISDENAVSGKFSSCATEASPYAGGWEDIFPDSLSGKSIQWICGVFMNADSNSKPVLAITLSKKEETVFWQSIEFPDSMRDGEWHWIMDTIEIPGDFTGEEYRTKSFLWNTNNKGKVFIDDLSMRFRSLPTQSFVPEYQFPKYKVTAKSTTSDLVVNLGSKRELISIAKGDKKLLNGLCLMEEWWDNNKLSCETRTSPLILEKVENDTLYFSASSLTLNSKIKIFYTSNQIVSNIEARVEKKGMLKRLAIVMKPCAPPHIIINNDACVLTRIEKEYWLGEGGFIFKADQDNNWVSQQQIGISSCQVSDSLVYFNLDLEYDHPLLHFPLRKNAQRGFAEDKSSSLYSSGDSLKATLQFDLLPISCPIPVIQNYPNGNEAAYLFTEHADYTDLKIHYAVCNGVDSIINPLNAQHGFAGNHIPVTKSVFYCNPDKVNNSECNAKFKSEVLNVKENKYFEKLLIDLKQLHWDIALHSPDHYTTTAEIATEALQYFNSVFKSSTWIDHGYDNGYADNREDLMCDALIKNSKNYMLEIWNAYKIKYVWNSWNEDQKKYSVKGFNQNLQLIYPYLQTSTPAPVIFKHPTRSANITHWLSNSLVDFDNDSWWEYYFNYKTMDQLCKNKGLVINHCYPARVKDSRYFWIKVNGHYQIHPEFEKVLKLLNEYSKQNRIWVCTVKDLIEYKEAIRNVNLRYDDKGFTLTNNNKSEILGITVCLPERVKYHGSTAIKEKRNANYENCLIINLKAGESFRVNYR